MKGVQFTRLFEPLKIGRLELKNRIVMSPMETCFGEENGTVSDRNIAYYRERARGGAGWIIVENTYVLRQGRSRRGQLGLDRDEGIPGLKRLVDAVHAHGAKISLQISHSGRQTKSQWAETQPVAPSPIPCTAADEIPRPLGVEEIREVVRAFGRAALRAREAGFDGVEVHGAHGYLIHQFLSPLSNQRNDDYGGPLENRMRLALEVVDEVKRLAGDGLTIGFRFTGSDYMEGGLQITDTLKVAGALERKGVEVLHVTGGMAGVPENGFMVTPPMAIPRGIHVPLAEAVKKEVRLPIIAVGRINTPELAEKILAEGKADLIAMGRAFLTDPSWPLKARAGEAEDIRRCIACNEACVTNLAQHLPIQCVQNPLLGREGEVEIRKAPRRKKVVVVGGGPAGLEAARICALRGHEVALYEEDEELGGRLLSAVLAPHKEEVGGILDYQIRQVTRLPIQVHKGSRMDETLLKDRKPDAVILATGSLPLGLEIFRPDGPQGIPRELGVLHAEDVLWGREVKGNTAAIIGGGMIGCEVADFLSQQGKKIYLIEMLNEFAQGMSARPRWLLLRRLRESGRVEMWANTKVRRIDGLAVTLEKDGKESSLTNLDSVILAIGYRSDDRLFTALQGRGMKLYAVGDCVKPRKAFEAIREGFDIGLEV